MDYRGQVSTRPTAHDASILRPQKKTPTDLIEAFQDLWNQARPAFQQQRTFERARRLALSALLCLGRHTLTGLIATGGCQDRDWSADFRLFERERFDAAPLLGVAREAVLRQLAPTDPLVALMDDTLMRKRGKKMAGTSWRRDPLGPPFHANFIWGQRFLQISAALPERAGASRARAIPIDLQHCPSPRKPFRQAGDPEWERYRQAQQETNIARRGVQRLRSLRQALDQAPEHGSRTLIAVVDGSYTNRTVLKSLPPRTILIGRIRQDARLYALPEGKEGGRGRKRCYGERVATPQELRQDDSLPWQRVQVYAAGKEHWVEFKTLAPVRWRNAGGESLLRIVAIRPLSYRLSQRSRLLYRKPVYLLCTDPELPLQRLIQCYVWRWEIELNFRDEKTLLGMEQAQVRTPQAVASVPTFLAAAYAFLLLAASCTKDLPQRVRSLAPKWRRLAPDFRPSTSQLISMLRKQMWGLGMEHINFSGFVHPSDPSLSRQKFQHAFHHAAFYAQG
jgi:hypothetical protein